MFARTLLPPNPAGLLEVRPFSSLCRSERAMLQVMGLEDNAPIEAWTTLGGPRAVSYSTHGIFRYFGKFPPPIAHHLIALHTDTGDLVCDPTAGSGTTGVEALLSARRSWVSDVNPLAVLLCRVKTRRVDLAMTERAIVTIAKNYEPIHTDATVVRNQSHWFLDRTVDSLTGLRLAIQQVADTAVRDILWVALAATIRRVSRATTQQGRQFLDPDSALEDALEVFLRRAQMAGTAVAGLPTTGAPSAAVEADARHPLPLSPNAAALTIIHPPYFNAYRYSSINSFELAWLGLPTRDVRRREVREYFKRAEVRYLPNYLDDVESIVAQGLCVTRPGGTLALMIGDSRLRGEHIQIVSPLLRRLVRRFPIELRGLALRRPRHAEASWATSQRRTTQALGSAMSDVILTFTKRQA